MPFVFDNTYDKLPSRLFSRVLPTPVQRPSLVAINAGLAQSLGLDASELVAPSSLEVFAGNRVPEGACSIAVAYAGHQFGGFAPQLGDGRAILLGEVVSVDKKRYDVVLKGSGRTPYSRGGDGRAAIGPVLREYLVSEAMVALGVPSTRALAAVTTGEFVERETRLPGAVLVRVAASHLRVGTFQFFAARKDTEALRLLTDYALNRHYPGAHQENGAALTLLNSVIEAQAKLVAKWQALGFVHGVMNTDNTAISGETIDFGPCAFLDTFVPNRTFSSIDHAGRYAYENQPRIAHWNLARLAEALLPLVDDDDERALAKASEGLDRYPERFNQAFAREMRRKLGLSTEQVSDLSLAQTLLNLMADSRVDYTLCFRRLTNALVAANPDSWLDLFREPMQAREWYVAWQRRLAAESISREAQCSLMRQANPAFIPRNHRVEEVLEAAAQGEFGPFERLHRVLGRPYEDQPEQAELELPPGEAQWSYRTFCGT